MNAVVRGRASLVYKAANFTRIPTKAVRTYLFTALAYAVYPLVLAFGRIVVGIGLATLALAFNEVMLVRRIVVRIGFSALALAFNEAMLVRRIVVGIGFTALALTFNKVVLVRRIVVRISFSTLGARTFYETMSRSGFAYLVTLRAASVLRASGISPAMLTLCIVRLSIIRLCVGGIAIGGAPGGVP